MDQSKGEVLEEEETEELAHSDVRPASMHQQEALQVTELSKGIVAGHDGLHSFLTTDSDADVCSWIFREQRQDVFRDGKTGILGSDNHLCYLLLIMFTSLAPSPMDKVTAFLYFFTKLTTLAFCFGVTRQQMTASHSHAMSTKSICGHQDFCYPSDDTRTDQC